MRLSYHPTADIDRGEKVIFYYNGQQITGYSNETIAAALYANGIRILGESHNLHRPRGIYCGKGDCASCLMTVNGQSNVRICTVRCENNMIIDSIKEVSHDQD